MPRNPKLLPQMLTWEHRYVAIYKCSPKEKTSQENEIVNGAEIKRNPDLQRVLGVLQQGMISKREYPNAASPTIRYATFRRSDPGNSNDAQLWLNKLIQAPNQREVRKWASKLATRYLGIQNVQKGVLIFLISLLKLERTSENCVFVFKCDFEDISQLTRKQVFKRIEDAFEEQAKKGAQYPYFSGRKFERNVVRVFDSLGETQYWQTFLDLVPRPSEATIQTAIISGLKKTHPEFIEKYSESLQSLPKERALATDEHPIEREDRFSPAVVEQVIAALPDTLSDSKISLFLDKARVSVPIREYGRTWTIAEQFSTLYVLLKGSQLEVHNPMLIPFDLTDLPDLQEAIARLGGPQGGGLNIPLSLASEKNPILSVYELFRQPGIKPLDEPGFLGFKNLKLRDLTSARAQEFIRFLRRTPVGALSLCRLIFSKERLIDFTANSVTEWFNWEAIERRQKLCANCKRVFSDFRVDLDAYQAGAPWPGEELEKDALALLDELEGCQSCGARFEVEAILDKDILVKEYLLGEPVNLKESVNALLWYNPESTQKAFDSFEAFLRFIAQRAEKPVVVFLYEPMESYQGDFFKILSLTDSAEPISKREKELAERLSAFTAQTLADYQMLCKKHQSEGRPTGRLDLPPSLFLQRKEELAQYPSHPLFTDGPLRSVLIYALAAWLAEKARLAGEAVHFGLPSRGPTGPEFPLVFSLTDVRCDGVSIFKKAKDWRAIVGRIVREIGQSAGNKELRGYWTTSLKSRSVKDFAGSQFFDTLEVIYGEFVERKERPKSISPTLIHLLVFLNTQRREIKFQLNGGAFLYEPVGEVPLGAGNPLLVASEMSELAKESLSRLLEVDRATKVKAPTVHRLETEGASLWENLIPKDLKKAYVTLRDLPDLTIYIVSDDPSFPWELVKPLQLQGEISPSQDIADEWWAMKFSLARWLSGFPPPPDRVALKNICCVATEVQLTAAADEIDHLKKLGVCDLPQTFDELISCLSEKDYDLIHFACHGRFDTKQPDESVVLLPDGSLLRPVDFLNLGIKRKFKKNHPLVFLNSCHSGRTGSTLIGLEGWAKGLIALNCGAFIGCGWEVNDRLAADFAIAFYKAFAGGETIARAVQDARGQIQKKEPKNSTWLAYYLFGNPNCLSN
jgi:hypothetical protein